MAAQVLLCPACGARNKTKWEFCARCGEALQGVTVRVTTGDVEIDEDPEEVSSLTVERPTSSLPGGLVLGVGLVLLGAIALAGLRFAWQAPPPERPDPGIWVAATQPAAPPPALASGPGAKEFREGSTLLAQKRAADAIPLLSQAAEAAPDKADYQQLLGEAYWATGAREQALGYFQRAAGLDPARRADYANALEDAGRAEAAVQEYRSILSQDAGNKQVQESLGRLYARTGNFTEAAPLLEKAAAAAPSDPVLLQELAYALEKTNDPAKAVVVYRQVVALAPDSPINRSRLAEGLLSQGKAEEAMSVLKEGITRTPQAPLLQRQMGSLLERSGNLADAAKAYRDYIQLAPDAIDAKELATRADTLDAIVAQRQKQ